MAWILLCDRQIFRMVIDALLNSWRDLHSAECVHVGARRDDWLVGNHAAAPIADLRNSLCSRLSPARGRFHRRPPRGIIRVAARLFANADLLQPDLPALQRG